MDRIVLQRQPVVIRNRADGEALGLIHFAGTDMSLSSVVVPMFAGDRFLGTIVIESYARENAFGESEVRLLSTVAAGIGAALENARLFAETQRLLKETERRARESSALSGVGRDLSSSLDLSVVMDRIAHHAKDFLQAANSAIFLPDAAYRHLPRRWSRSATRRRRSRRRRSSRASASSAACCKAARPSSSTTSSPIRAACRCPAPTGAPTSG